MDYIIKKSETQCENNPRRCLFLKRKAANILERERVHLWHPGSFGAKKSD
jgi:hypothetical protein